MDKVSLEIDVEKLFGKKITDPGLRRNIAESLIDKINERTASGKGVNGNGSEVKLKAPYSAKYAGGTEIDKNGVKHHYDPSPEFKAFGKKKNEVNMKLTGSMLASIDLISDSAKKIEIGIDNEEAPKSYNHMVGDTVPQRPFLGLTSDDLEEVKSEYADQVASDDIITAADIFDRRKLTLLTNIITRSFKPKISDT